MNETATSWKVFRAVCILQLVLLALQLMLLVAGIFYTTAVLFTLLELALYTLVFVFVCQGLVILNYNFPDTPLRDKQKKQFNWLFIINFLLIAYLFAQVVKKWWIVPLLMEAGFTTMSSIISLTAPLLLAIAVFILHLLFLAGMVRLRRALHQNTIQSWYRQFDEKEQD